MKDNKSKRDLSGRFISNKKTIKASKTSKTEEPVMVANVKKTLINALNRVAKLEEELKELKILTSSRQKEEKQDIKQVLVEATNNPSNLNEAYIYEVDVNLPGGIKSIIRTSDKLVFKIGDYIKTGNYIYNIVSFTKTQSENQKTHVITANFKPGNIILASSAIESFVLTLKPKEPELNTFEDCWNKVSPKMFIHEKGGITTIQLTEIQSIAGYKYKERQNAHFLPSREHIEWIQELIKLQVVATALNPKDFGVRRNEIFWFNITYGNKLTIVGTTAPVPNIGQILFATKELAQKAISILGEESIKKALRVYVS